MVTEKIKPGYKQTEIGIIPEDWDVDFIKNHALITTGAKNTQDRIDGGRYPFFVRSQKVERINSYSFDGEAVLTAGDGVGTGKVFHYIKGKFDFHQRVYKISNFDDNLDGYFFYLYFSNHFLDRIMSMTAKSSVDSVRMEMISDMQIPLPDKPEQIAIANSLLGTEKLICTLEKLIIKKENLKKGIMQDLLTSKRRLTGFDKSWEKLKLIQITSIPVTDGPHLTPRFLTDGVPFLSVNNIVNNKINWNDLRYISKSDDEDFSKKCKPKKGDILLGKAATVGTVAVVESDIDFNIWSPLALIRINNRNIAKFIYYCFQTPMVINQIKLLTNSSSQGNIGMRDIEKLEFFIPEKEEQLAISKVLSDLDKEIEEIEQLIDKYLNIKKGMMQQLLTGRIRLT
jgi:type I restriction enzyme, S subunit